MGRQTETVVEGAKETPTQHSISLSLAALRLTLGQLLPVLKAMEDKDFVSVPDGSINISAICSHVRHVLDHIDAYILGIESLNINYHNRIRDTDAERSRAIAINKITYLDNKLALLENMADQPILVTDIILTGGQPQVFSSSLAREAAFVLSHTIHHYAMIAFLIRGSNQSIPEGFGYAPSTITWLHHPVDAQ